MRVGITVDDWKLPIFERHLSQAGYTVAHGGSLAPGTALLLVTTGNAEALQQVVQAACNECGGSGPVH